jgi:hypothetical protein
MLRVERPLFCLVVRAKDSWGELYFSLFWGYIFFDGRFFVPRCDSNYEQFRRSTIPDLITASIFLTQDILFYLFKPLKFCLPFFLYHGQLQSVSQRDFFWEESFSHHFIAATTSALRTGN